MSELPEDIEQLRPWITVRFSRSAGPGGQNVNKLSTRVTLLFDLANCGLLTAEQMTRLRAALASRISREGVLRVVSQQERTQSGNRELAERRLLELLRVHLKVTRPRRPTRRTAGSQERRIREKRTRADVLGSRRPRDPE